MSFLTNPWPAAGSASYVNETRAVIEEIDAGFVAVQSGAAPIALAGIEEALGAYAPLEHMRSGVANVLDYPGVDPTGSTDSTSGLQAALDAQRVVDFRMGHYKISVALDLTGISQRNIVGLHPELCIIEQTTADTPIFTWLDEGSGDQHSNIIRGMSLTHTNAPGSGTTQQYGIQFRATADGEDGLGYGYYYNQFDNLSFGNCYIDIGPYTTDGGVCPVWSSLFRDIRTTNPYLSSVRLVSDGNAGQPNNRIERIEVHYPGITPAGPAINTKGCTGLVIINPNIEDGVNTAISIQGGRATTLISPRFERHTFAGAAPNLILMEDGNLVANGADVHFEDASIHTGVASIYRLSGSASAQISGLYVEANETGAGYIQAIGGDPATNVAVINGFTTGAPSVFGEYLPSGFGPDLYVRSSSDGNPPKVDALPGASAAYRGRMFRVEGGAGVADVTSVCQKDAADAYNWVAMT